MLKKINKKIKYIFLFMIFCNSCGNINYEARSRYRKKNNSLYVKYNYSNTNSNTNYKKNKNYMGHYKIGKPYKIDGITYYPREDKHYKEVGMASWYGEDFHNKKTANGEIYNMNDMTAAHRTLPLPSMVRVTNLENANSVIVRVNDRGPFVNNRIIDLSKKAAKKLGFKDKGVVRVRVEFLNRETEKMLKAYNLK